MRDLLSLGVLILEVDALLAGRIEQVALPSVGGLPCSSTMDDARRFVTCESTVSFGKGLARTKSHLGHKTDVRVDALALYAITHIFHIYLIPYISVLCVIPYIDD
ncbi:hypothetical protein NKH52_16250 [Mesorhizobium sp. M1066]|uniref:hypothetical protein n=1 Tax=unclassified Mesorhizobium TaxID=325217 RepID=UPI00333D3A4C